MPVVKLSADLRRLTLSAALFAASLASAHLVNVHHAESGFGRIKLAPRERGWREETAAVRIIGAPARNVREGAPRARPALIKSDGAL